MSAHSSEIISLADRYRVPAIYPYRFFAELGGLLSYGIDQLDNFRRAAIYVDRILKGARPSELPVQVPVKFELVINLKTAKTLGLTIPPLLLARADAVISNEWRNVRYWQHFSDMGGLIGPHGPARRANHF